MSCLRLGVCAFAVVLASACAEYRNEKIDQRFEEIASEMKKPVSRPAPNPEPECVPALPAKTDKVVFVSGYEGLALSPIAIAGLDNTTRVVELAIEPGEEKLFVVASISTASIWKISGDTERVSNFLTAPYGSTNGVGVVGLKPDNVSFMDWDCLETFKDPLSEDGKAATAKWTKLIDRAPDHVIGEYKIKHVKVPSGKVDKSQLNERASLGDYPNVEMRFYPPGGVVDIALEDVVAVEPVERYEVLPGAAGLVQLIKTGHLKPLEKGVFRIEKPISHYPAGLVGPEAVVFVLPKRMPLPEGRPGHSSVYSEKTKKCVYRSRCKYAPKD